MSILIRSMKMPESCGKCFVGDRTICTDGCPLVEVKEPHGRLIDKDKLRHDLFVNFNGERIPFYDYNNVPTKITYRDMHSILADQKTVIEAEGSEE